MDDVLAGIKAKYKDRHIVIAWPSLESTDCRFNDALMELVAQNLNIISLGLAHSISSRISINRNKCVDKARSLGATDILWVDADTTFPTNGLIRLLMHDKDIVGATTRRRDNRGFPVGIQENPEEHEAMVKMRLLGFPFMLTSMRVFEKLERPYFSEAPRKLLPEIDTMPDELIGEDEYWCHNVRKAGFDIWCDMRLSTEIGHVTTEVKFIEQEYIQYPDAQKLDERL